MLVEKNLTSNQLKLLFCVLIRNEKVFNDLTNLSVEHFEQVPHKLLFNVLKAHWEENHELPNQVTLREDVKTILEHDNDLLNSSETKQIYSLIKAAFDGEYWSGLSPTDTNLERRAYKFASILMQRAVALAAVRSLSNMQDLSEFPDMLQDTMEAVQKTLLQNKGGANLLFPDSWDTSNIFELTTTGLKFFDDLLNGGAKVGEAYGYMAPYGTCKTTVAVQLWSEASKLAAVRTDNKIGLSFYVSYEAPQDELQQRILMYDAQVHRNSLEHMGKMGIAALGSNPLEPKEYEQSRFKELLEVGLFKPERERVLESIQRLNNHCVLIDMTGGDKNNPGAGSGGVREIVRRIKAELLARGPNYVVQNVIIDYLGLLVDRDNSNRGKKIPDDHKLYQTAVSDIVRLISVPFETHTWIIHQLSGEANSIINPTKKLDHTSAKGSKSFAENLHFCFVSGALTLEGLGMLSCTKQRRAKRKPSIIIRLLGEFNCVAHAETFTLDSKGKIVNKADLGSIATIDTGGIGVATTTSASENVDEDTENPNPEIPPGFDVD